jgi:hypothetical protein
MLRGDFPTRLRAWCTHDDDTDAALENILICQKTPHLISLYCVRFNYEDCRGGKRRGASNNSKHKRLTKGKRENVFKQSEIDFQPEMREEEEELRRKSRYVCGKGGSDALDKSV